VVVRRLALSLFVGALLAGSTVGVSAAGGIKIPGDVDPVPPYLNVPLPAVCQVHYEAKFAEITCTATEPNPNPPKDTKTAKVNVAPKESCKYTFYPDGGAVVDCRYTGSLPG